MRLDGKTILITGAASGIGQASAMQALTEGARVIGIDQSGDGIPHGVEPIVGDVTDDGTIDTPMLNRSLSRAEDPAEARAYSQNRHALKRFGRAEEIANGVIYLLSDEASFNTGSVVTIDGGWRAA